MAHTELLFGTELVLFDNDTYLNNIPLWGWTVKTGASNYRSVRATKLPYIGSRISRLILNCDSHQLVDHINGNPLDNRRSNLRLVSHSQNQYNKVVASSKKSGLPKGVYLNKRLNNYYAQIRVAYRRIHLGSFKTVAEAELAYIEAAAKYQLEFAVHLSREFK